MFLTTFIESSGWRAWGLLIARIFISGVFLMGVIFKVLYPAMQAQSVAAVGLPFPMLLVVLGAIFEGLLVVSFLSGLYFREMALLAIPYILFLGYWFHGPSMWAANQMEFGFFVDHFTFTAALIYMSVTGPGRFAWKK